MDDIEELPLYEGCLAYVQRNWLSTTKADRLFEDIKRQIPFGEYQIKMGAKIYDVPRGIFAFGDDGICTNDVNGEIVEGTGHVYGRPKKKYLSFAWDTPIEVLQNDILVPDDCSQPLSFHHASDQPPGPNDVPVGKRIRRIMQHLNQNSHAQFNAVLINEYRTGKDSISKHSDQEVVEPYNEVYGISLGESRIIHFVSLDGKDKHEIELRHGDLMVMSGDTQKYYTHEIRKRVNKGLRISLTFRALPM